MEKSLKEKFMPCGDYRWMALTMAGYCQNIAIPCNVFESEKVNERMMIPDSGGDYPFDYMQIY